MTAEEFVCFVYHRFGDDRYPSTNIAVDTFRRQLEFLQDNDITVLTLGEALRRADAGNLAGPTVVLTVDDGYQTFQRFAMPLLQEFGMPATLFVTTDTVGGRDMLSWEDLRELAALGIELGNHTRSHEYFLDLPDTSRQQAFRQDVAQAQAQFLQHLKVEPVLFSYPFGEQDAGMRAVVQQLGFAAAVGQQSGVVGAFADRFALPRYPMGGPYATLAGFVTKARMRALPVLRQSVDAGHMELAVRPEGVHLDKAQCFVGGETACGIVTEVRADTTWLRMSTSLPITARRTLFTITAPSRQGGLWYWHSHVVVRPEAGGR